jgi:glycosyltransferase involved in cell wall biosynthesis
LKIKNFMRVAIVHDYIKEFGGAERVLEALTEIFPDAPIYTAFVDKNSEAFKRLKNKEIITSWAQSIPFFASRLHSPLRFLAPFIWGSFDFSDYDVVISSASWYVTKGFKKLFGKNHFIEICYCHTPPRWLYGYATSVKQKNILIRIYAVLVGHFMRMYDFESAQEVDYFVANSEEVKNRIKKFYRRDATIIYPPVSLPKYEIRNTKYEKDYYLIVSRITGAKGLELAIAAAKKMGIKLKIAGSSTNYSFEQKKLLDESNENIQFLGQVTDEELVNLYKNAKAFLALAKDEDFGITPVEAMLCGTPVVAFNGGGYKETVLDKKTGLLFNDYSTDGLIKAIKEFESLKINSKDCIIQAQKFSKERFKEEIISFLSKISNQ